MPGGGRRSNKDMEDNSNETTTNNDLAILITNLTLKIDRLEKSLTEKVDHNTQEIADTKLSVSTNTSRLDSLEELVAKHTDSITDLSTNLDDLQNRSLRKTLIFKNIAKSNDEVSWTDTKNVLTKIIHDLQPEVLREKIYKQIERAHRGKASKEYDGPPFIYALFTNWCFSEQVKELFQTESMNNNSTIYVSQMFSKSVTARRAKAFEHRRELRKATPTVKSHVKFPAVLMVKYDGETKYKTLQSF